MIVLGIVGVKGLLYLLIIGIVVFLGAILLSAQRSRRRPGRRSARLHGRPWFNGIAVVVVNTYRVSVR